jgi:voltage-dependent calcium channel
MLLLIVLVWVLFAVLGAQTFNSELNRSCVWPSTTTSSSNFFEAIGFRQPCGGWLDANGTQQPWQQVNGQPRASKPGGYLCPQPAVCIEGTNPSNATLSFDDFGHSLELVFVVMSGSSFSRLMYPIIDSSYLSSAICKSSDPVSGAAALIHLIIDFAVVYIVFRLWLLNVVSPLNHSSKKDSEAREERS